MKRKLNPQDNLQIIVPMNPSKIQKNEEFVVEERMKIPKLQKDYSKELNDYQKKLLENYTTQKITFRKLLKDYKRCFKSEPFVCQLLKCSNEEIFEFIPKKLQTATICFVALEINYNNYKHLRYSFKNNTFFLREAALTAPNVITNYVYGKQDILTEDVYQAYINQWKNKSIDEGIYVEILGLHKNYMYNQKISDIVPWFRAKKELLLEVAKHDPPQLRLIDREITKDKEFCVELIKLNGLALAYMPDLCMDDDLLEIAFETEKNILDLAFFLSKHKKVKKLSLAEKAIQHNPLNIAFLDKEIYDLKILFDILKIGQVPEISGIYLNFLFFMVENLTKERIAQLVYDHFGDYIILCRKHYHHLYDYFLINRPNNTSISTLYNVLNEFGIGVRILKILSVIESSNYGEHVSTLFRWNYEKIQEKFVAGFKFLLLVEQAIRQGYRKTNFIRTNNYLIDVEFKFE